MNFMQDDEFLLLMVHCEDRAEGFEAQHILTIPERIRLRQAGIKTAHEQPAWLRIEPQRGEYDFAYLDNIINRNREAGLKSLIQVSGWQIPKWIPADWRARTQSGILHGDMLSIWNDEAQAYSDDYYHKLYTIYNDPDIMWFFGEFQGGEGVIPPDNCFYDPAAIEDYKYRYGTSAMPDINNPETIAWLGDSCLNHLLRKAAILYPRYKENWSCLQRLMDRWSKSYGNFIHPELLETYRKLWPDGNIVLLQYTYFDDSHDQDCVDFVDHLIEVSNCETIVEAMFCEGLPATTPKAIDKGFRGQIVHPVNKFEQTSLEDWMVDNIRNSHNMWIESRQNEDHRLHSDIE